MFAFASYIRTASFVTHEWLKTLEVKAFSWVWGSIHFLLSNCCKIHTYCQPSVQVAVNSQEVCLCVFARPHMHLVRYMKLAVSQCSSSSSVVSAQNPSHLSVSQSPSLWTTIMRNPALWFTAFDTCWVYKEMRLWYHRFGSRFSFYIFF